MASASDLHSKKIVLLGATGQQGGQTVRALQARGFTNLTAIVRPESVDGEKATALKKSGVAIVPGSWNDSDSLKAALADAYGFFLVTTPYTEGPAAETQHGLNAVAAAADAGVQHVVFTSVGSADRKTGIPHFDSKAAVEEALKKTSLEWTIIRPVFFMQNLTTWFKPKEGVYYLPINDDTKLQMVDSTDIGDFAALAFDQPETWKGKAVELAGDELTGAETAAAFAEVLGKPHEFKSVPKPADNEDFKLMFEWFDNVGYCADIPALRRDALPNLRNLKTFLAANKQAFE